ncbi:MAG TPA: enoyl-CoA hydratase/isomerase family protein [Caulobacteraceae bacterium]|jgi:enoyl-CoA hydratase/carnithine racemase|nr:enoyl-CoA hydratase/isomerase family protein [Caulobacteraceae bacterium]
MAYEGYQRLRIARDGRIVTATVDNPPINLITLELFGELARLSQEVADDRDATVFVLKSANPDFFLAHFDVGAILSFPVDRPAERAPAGSNTYHAMCERFRTMDKATIAQIEGRVGGGGSELSMSFDMRFGVIGKTIVNQMEVPLGILPGGTGTQRMPRLIGRHRAMEVILGGIDLDAETAERWGYLNRALPAGEIGPYVDALARRIASFPAEAVRLAKQSVTASDLPLADGLVEESYLFQQSIRTDGARRNMARFLEIGGQTREGELRVGALNAELGDTG